MKITAPNKEQIYQYGILDSLKSGVYSGTSKVSSILSMGDFGLGTYDALDGEMLVLDGVAYQMKLDGIVQIANSDTLVPYASVTYFKSKIKKKYSNDWNSLQLDEVVGQYLSSKNIFYAIKITGLFSAITIRNVALQEKPYLHLAAVLENEKVVTRKNIKGTLVGYWTPVFSQEIIGEGFHFHFVSQDKKFGGHAHNFKVMDSVIEIMPIYDLQLQLSSYNDYLNAKLIK